MVSLKLRLLLETYIKQSGYNNFYQNLSTSIFTKIFLFIEVYSPNKFCYYLDEFAGICRENEER